MSVLFSNTRTCLLYNEQEIFNTAGSEAECNIENFEFTAGDRLTMASRPNTAQFLCVIVITHSVTLMSPGNEKSRDQS